MLECNTLRTLIACGLPCPRLRPGASGLPRSPVKRIVVFGRHPNPTSDYYFAARLAAPGMPSHQFADIRDDDFSSIDPDGAFVIVCRYASRAILDWIDQQKSRIAGVGLFLDDDIPSVFVSNGADMAYRYFVLRHALLPLRRLNRHLDIVWASTPNLAKRLKHAKAVVLPPAPPTSLWETPHPLARNKSNEITIAYHATALHVEEHTFLSPIIHAVLAARQNTRFEVFAGRETAAIWADTDRVTVRKPIPWSTYLEEASSRKIDIMLVPLARSTVNDCRAPTKRIDVARMGAAGIFSISHAYGEPGSDGEILLPYNAIAWQNAIISMIDDEEKRQVAAAATRQRVAAMSRTAKAGLALCVPSTLT